MSVAIKVLLLPDPLKRHVHICICIYVNIYTSMYYTCFIYYIIQVYIFINTVNLNIQIFKSLNSY